MKLKNSWMITEIPWDIPTRNRRSQNKQSYGIFCNAQKPKKTVVLETSSPKVKSVFGIKTDKNSCYKLIQFVAAVFQV